MYAESKSILPLDPRTKLILLVLANIIAFAQRSLYIEIAWIVFLLFLITLCGCGRQAFKLLTMFCVCLALQLYILPHGPNVIGSSFIILVSYARKIFPCLIIGVLITKKTSIREIMAVLELWHFPKSLIIALSVTLRYFPAIKEELHYIKDAMKFRNFRGMYKIEGYLVPMILCATTTAEELSAAAVARGIENSKPKTTIIDLKWNISDILVLIISIIFCFFSFKYR
ncbi:energy-coupling factor transporter transmembrane component T [Hathewaya limosa]|uniref:Energy-coupling factor transport system permease protein n=1 Tax=Hathewaya limosa TaxID=1536 RepID=A0ABU0JP39_HATLI|nr:energy-coupling factor transporter transmembrane component T [Hathewaya limosa]MDQ0478849.1 energy-coupling factor transport system permease protein [Hathewaya limosa]